MITGKQNVGVSQPTVYTAHLILPPGLSREVHVRHCLSLGTVLIKSVDNEIEGDVQVSRNLIHFLRFPIKSGEKGSAVTCVRDPMYRTSKVVAVLQDEDEEQLIFEENQFRIHKRNGDNFVDFDIKGNTGEIDITADSGDSSDVESSFNFKNRAGKAKVKVFVQGKLKIIADDNIDLQTEKFFKLTIQDNDIDNSKPTTISYKSGTGFEFIDEFENVIKTSKSGLSVTTKNGEEFKLEKKGFTLKNSKEDLKKIMKDTLQEIMGATLLTPSGSGTISPTTIAKLQQISSRIDKLFS